MHRPLHSYANVDRVFICRNNCGRKIKMISVEDCVEMEIYERLEEVCRKQQGKITKSCRCEMTRNCRGWKLEARNKRKSHYIHSL